MFSLSVFFPNFRGCLWSHMKLVSDHCHCFHCVLQEPWHLSQAVCHIEWASMYQDLFRFLILLWEVRWGKLVLLILFHILLSGHYSFTYFLWHLCHWESFPLLWDFACQCMTCTKIFSIKFSCFLLYHPYEYLINRHTAWLQTTFSI